MLNDMQREAAEALLAKRPPVLPGTKAIISDTAREDWYGEVNATMRTTGVSVHDVDEFCDAAGVAD